MRYFFFFGIVAVAIHVVGLLIYFGARVREGGAPNSVDVIAFGFLCLLSYACYVAYNFYRLTFPGKSEARRPQK